MYHTSTHRVTCGKLEKQNSLLEPRKRAEINCEESANSTGAEAAEERVYIRNVVLSISRIEYPRAYEGRNSAVLICFISMSVGSKEL